MEEQQFPQPNPGMDLLIKLRDIEEKNRLLRDRILLIGKNLIETKEEIEQDLTQLKPKYVFIRENVGWTIAENVNIDYIKLLSQSEKFKSLWKHYSFIGKVNDDFVYEKIS